jgi:hypothetical protein
VTIRPAGACPLGAWTGRTTTAADRRRGPAFWLHSLTTQDTEHLAPGSATQALVLSPNGHVEHHLTMTDDGAAVWIHVEPGTAESLLAFLQSMRFLLRVDPADVTREFALLTLMGPDAAGVPPDDAVVTMADSFGMDVIVPRDRIAGIAADLQQRGVRLAGVDAYEALGSRRTGRGWGWTPIAEPSRTGGLDRYRHPCQGCYGAGRPWPGAQPGPSHLAGVLAPRRERGNPARPRRPGHHG